MCVTLVARASLGLWGFRTMSGGSVVAEVRYLVLPDSVNPYLLARVRWPDVAQAISMGRPEWQADPGLFDLPYDPNSAEVSPAQAASIAARWGAHMPSDTAEPSSSLIRRMPANWSDLTPAEKRAWSLETRRGAARFGHYYRPIAVVVAYPRSNLPPARTGAGGADVETPRGRRRRADCRAGPSSRSGRQWPSVDGGRRAQAPRKNARQGSSAHTRRAQDGFRQPGQHERGRRALRPARSQNWSSSPAPRSAPPGARRSRLQRQTLAGRGFEHHLAKGHRIQYSARIHLRRAQRRTARTSSALPRDGAL